MDDSPAQMARIARRFPEDVATEGRLELLDELLTDDYVEHSPFGGLEGREAAAEQLESLRAAFPDFTATVEDVVAEGDLVAMRVTLRGTHEGEFMGIEATGNSFEVPNGVFTRIEGDRIAERWIVPDLLGMLQQLGVVPEEPGAMSMPSDD